VPVTDAVGPDLSGCGVLITRPAEQSGPLIDAIVAAGGTALCLPALEISARDADEIAAELDGLPEPDITLFVSPNAVRFGIAYAGGLVGAIGPGTAAAIREAGVTVDIVPSAGYASEQLLMEDTLNDLRGRTVRIVRGQSGRELLGSTLAHRGARVDYLGVYERRAASPDPQTVDEVLSRWERGGIDAWTIMSVETLDHFLDIVGVRGRELAARTPLVTPAERVIIEAGERLPGAFVSQSDGTSPDALVDAIDAVIVHD
jgi:uroporphyrinogen-III synthase